MAATLTGDVGRRDVPKAEGCDAMRELMVAVQTGTCLSGPYARVGAHIIDMEDWRGWGEGEMGRMGHGAYEGEKQRPRGGSGRLGVTSDIGR